jgi:hypothetical protein
MKWAEPKANFSLARVSQRRSPRRYEVFAPKLFRSQAPDRCEVFASFCWTAHFGPRSASRFSPLSRPPAAASWHRRSDRGSSRCCGSSARTGSPSRRPTARALPGCGRSSRTRTTTTSSSTPLLPPPPSPIQPKSTPPPAPTATTSSSSAATGARLPPPLFGLHCGEM